MLKRKNLLTVGILIIDLVFPIFSLIFLRKVAKLDNPTSISFSVVMALPLVNLFLPFKKLKDYLIEDLLLIALYDFSLFILIFSFTS